MMEVDGLRIPLDHLPVSYAGLEVMPVAALIALAPDAQPKVGVEVRVAEDDFALSPFEYTARVLSPAAFALCDAVDRHDRALFVGVTFRSVSGRLHIDAWRRSAA